MTSKSSNHNSPESLDHTSVSFGRADTEYYSDHRLVENNALAAYTPRRSSGARNKLVVLFNFLISIAVLAVIFAGIAIYFGLQAFDASGPLKLETTVMVKKGVGLDSIVGILESKGIIDQPLLFTIGVRANQAQRKLKAGEYAFKPGVSMRQVMTTLTSGKAILHAFTVPEGLTSTEILRRLAENSILQGDLPSIPDEGALLPETYNFPRGTTRQAIISQMMQNQNKQLAEIWADRAPEIPLSTPQELVILASIVEKETGVAGERPLVASVFINRLNKGMKLQSDPTIIYGIFGGRGKPKDRPIYRSDIDKPTPYNTYTIPALPPGPIANPGRASMKAVARPAQSEFLYFVADGTGGHVFAKTLKEHQANVVMWRAIEKQQAAETKKSVNSNDTDN